ncbi:MAG: hypothetical protein GY717_16265 [Rhodobacteraceae bacterium]|nr:hypothetical protein [Paracoccaceae bacterium]
MKKLLLTLPVAALIATSAISQTSTGQFLADCRALVGGAGKGGDNCEAMLEGALGAFGLINKEFYPVSGQLGYCIDPFTTPQQAARAIIDFAEANPDCAKLSHFSMCMNMAFSSVYAGTC